MISLIYSLVKRDHWCFQPYQIAGDSLITQWIIMFQCSKAKAFCNRIEVIFTCSKRRAAPSRKHSLGQSGFSSLQTLASDKACLTCPNRNQQRLRLRRRYDLWGQTNGRCSKKMPQNHKMDISFRSSFNVEYLCVSIDGNMECVLSSCFCFCAFPLCFWRELWNI